MLADYIAPLREAGCRVSLFIGHDPAQIEASARIGAAVVELHTGAYCDLDTEGRHADRDRELAGLVEGARLADSLGLEVHAGHGLTFDTVGPIAAIPQVKELNIGHFLIAESVFIGLDGAIREMRRRMDEARQG
jgi:pyridoxine 5-phosphate synthase